MRLNKASDFALRIMMFVAKHGGPVTVEEIARRLKLVKSHTMKIVAKLSKAGLLVSRRGRMGGVKLARPASQILIGDIVREIESDFALVECMQPGENKCVFCSSCDLRGVVGEAMTAFMNVLDSKTLGSVTARVKLPEDAPAIT